MPARRDLLEGGSLTRKNSAQVESYAEVGWRKVERVVPDQVVVDDRQRAVGREAIAIVAVVVGIASDAPRRHDVRRIVAAAQEIDVVAIAAQKIVLSFAAIEDRPLIAFQVAGI